MFNQETLVPARHERADRSGKNAETKIAVIGLGYVGLPLAITAAEKGFSVIGYDISEEKINKLQHKQAYFLSTEEQELFKRSDMQVGSSVALLIDVNVFIICVPTPVNGDYTPDLTALIEASRTVGLTMERGSLVIVESTINPGVSEELIIPILEYESDMRVERDFYFAHCPERINPGDAKYSSKNIPRVIGASGEASMERALSLYESILEAEVKPMATIKEAEAVKMVENAFRDINIAFVNELAMAFEKEGIDIMHIIEGASTKPFGFLPHYPGCGVGGHCIPVDPYYLIQYGKRHGFTHHLLLQARQINNQMPHHTVALLRKALYSEDKSLHNTRIALLGLAYKKNIGDIRESPALAIRNELEREGAHVSTYDPYIPEASTANSLAEALTNASAAIIATSHDSFLSLHPEDFLRFNVPIVIDGRNCLSKEEFARSPIIYRGIGR